MSKLNDDLIILDDLENSSNAFVATPSVSLSSTGANPVYLIKRNKIGSLSYNTTLTPRVIEKNGKHQIHRSNFSTLIIFYIRDLANTLIKSRWKWIFLYLSFVFMLIWLTFACLWMIIAISNGDLDSNKNNQTLLIDKPCLIGFEGFAGYLLFSIESQSSIGYGNRYITHHCPEAVLLLCVQMMTGICIGGLLISIVYRKISGPRTMNTKNPFSRSAVICQRDGEFCLMFRLRDYDRRYECRNEIKAYLVQKRGNSEVFLTNIRLENTGIMLWPIEVVHKINKTSRFWDLSAKDLIIKKFEIIVVMEGISVSTGNTSRTTTSYLSNEILWGHQFVPCVDYDKAANCYIVNHKLFNATREVVIPLCSAQRLSEVIQEANPTSPSSSPSASVGVDSGFLATTDVSPDESIVMGLGKSLRSSPSSSNDSNRHQTPEDRVDEERRGVQVIDSSTGSYLLSGESLTSSPSNSSGSYRHQVPLDLSIGSYLLSGESFTSSPSSSSRNSSYRHQIPSDVAEWGVQDDSSVSSLSKSPFRTNGTHQEPPSSSSSSYSHQIPSNESVVAEWRVPEVTLGDSSVSNSLKKSPRSKSSHQEPPDVVDTMLNKQKKERSSIQDDTRLQDNKFSKVENLLEQFITTPVEDDKLKNTSTLMMTSNKANKRTYNETSF